MKKFDVTALGELLIDFTDNGKSAQGNTLFEANPGGAPCNVLAMLNKCGHPTAFIGKVGKDIFGLKLKSTLEEVGINTSNLIVDEMQGQPSLLYRPLRMATGISLSSGIPERTCCLRHRKWMRN